MNPMPFYKLAKVRSVNRPELPQDLADFYTAHEGVGLESPADRTIRLGRLSEVQLIGWKDLHIHSFSDCVPEGWEKFAAFLLGVGMFFEEIVYVLNAPCCGPGSILEIGVDLPGPGGKGPAPIESSLLLAASLAQWLEHHKRFDWAECADGGLAGLPRQERSEIIQYYLTLNPRMNIAKEG
jgi:hypothetical protein